MSPLMPSGKHDHHPLRLRLAHQSRLIPAQPLAPTHYQRPRHRIDYQAYRTARPPCAEAAPFCDRTGGA